MEPNARKAAVATLSVVSNSTLVIIKIVVGVMIGSVSVISEAIHSGVDLLASAIALIAVKKSAKPADAEHPFGHGKYENISGVVEAMLIFVAAGWIIYEAVKKFISPQDIEMPGWGVGVMLISAVCNWVVSRVLFKVGKDTDSIALQADGWHLRTDVWTSVGVMAGLAAIWTGDVMLLKFGIDGEALNFLHYIDPAAAIVVAMLIIHAAWRLTVDSTSGLLDAELPKEEQEWIAGMLNEHSPTIRGFHCMRTRKAGAMRFIDVHIFVDGHMTVNESHKLSHELAQKVQEHFGASSVTVHVEPYR